MTDDLKAAIEAVGFHKFHFDGIGRGEEFATTLALAEIGRLAVEFRCNNESAPAHEDRKAMREWAERTNASEFAMEKAVDAFLAGRGK